MLMFFLMMLAILMLEDVYIGDDVFLDIGGNINDV